MRRSNGFGTLLGLVLVVLLFIARPGCDLQNNPLVIQDYYPPAKQQTPPNTPVQQVGHSSTTPSTIIMGSFNIQSFGPTKASRPNVMNTLADIARKYDLLAIQELRNADQSVIEQFIRLINSDGSRYRYIIGSRQGYTYSKEQYAYIYDAAKFRVTSRPYDAPNTNDNALHRPPLVASFECTQAPQGQGFTFTLINIHTDPDEVDKEFAALETLIPAIVNHHENEDDFIIMGDFNDSAKAIQRYRWLENQLPLVRSSWSTKVRSGRSLDNIVINSLRTMEFNNQSGVLNVATQYGLDEQQALLVSDHFPVWAVFSTQERESRVAHREEVRTSR